MSKETTNLATQIKNARGLIFRDGYDMSIGEISNLYDKNELVINPEYQRLFRWEDTQKTRFIESILLNIPIPPIFVFTQPNGRWELVDGLQRVSTILQFTGKLAHLDPFSCDGTNLLPSLAGARWPTTDEEELSEKKLPPNVLNPTQCLSIKRSRLRVEILGPETDNAVKFELFQRLNTGGSNLSEQEIRNCIIVSIRPGLLEVLRHLAHDDDFLSMIPIGGVREERQYSLELILRAIVYRNYEYNSKFDVHEYLDKSTISMCEDDDFPIDEEAELIKRTLHFAREVGGDRVFYKNERFSLAYYEFIMLGLSRYIENGGSDKSFIRKKIKSMTANAKIDSNTGAGVRGTTRLGNIIFGMSESFFE